MGRRDGPTLIVTGLVSGYSVSEHMYNTPAKMSTRLTHGKRAMNHGMARPVHDAARAAHDRSGFSSAAASMNAMSLSH